MNRHTLFKSILISFFLLICNVLFFLSDVSAASTDTETASVQLSAEEQAYLERSGEITIGCPSENCPLLFQNEKSGQMEGITIDILNMISEATGLTFRYQPLPSGNITYETLQQLDVDMVAGVESNEVNKHSPGIAMTDPYLHAEKVFVCKRGVVFHPDSPMVIAVATGSQTLGKIICQQYPAFQILYCDSTEEALSALLTGEADAVLQNQYTVERILCKPVYENLQIVATASIGDSQSLACLVPISEDGQAVISSDTSLLLSILNKGIASLDQSQVSFIIIRETAENAYQFTMWDMLYRYRFPAIILFVSLLMIIFLLRRNRLLQLKHTEQMAAQQRAKELAAINARMKEQQLLLKDALKHAEEGNRAKTTFLFNMSHDIRTPMNAILGFAEIARRNTDNTARLTDCLEKIQVSGKHLLQLINNVLDTANIETDNITLAQNSCNLVECIDNVRSILQTEAEKKHLTFQADMSTVKNPWVCCDHLRINQILLNLLSNAVKFSKPGGHILLTLSQQACAIQEYAAYEIRVKDNGIGMSPEFLSRIFNPFEREHTSTISQTQGTGLGMSITKNLVDLMGGDIQVSSEPDHGTEFVLQFTFRLQEPPQQEQQQTMQLSEQQQLQQRSEQQPEQPSGQLSQQQTEQLSGQLPQQQTEQLSEQLSQQQPPAETAAADDFSGRRLLLVEDNELNMEIAQDILCEAGFLVETAQNGQIAVEMVRNSVAGYYDAVLMDIQMPVMNGYQASREIRSLENKALAKIPIIALTANAFDEDKKKALANGMNAHIAKPLDTGVLFETLGKILSGK